VETPNTECWSQIKKMVRRRREILFAEAKKIDDAVHWRKKGRVILGLGENSKFQAKVMIAPN